MNKMFGFAPYGSLNGGEKVENGGKGSGNFGHAGRPGEVGGSAPSGASSNSDIKVVSDIAEDLDWSVDDLGNQIQFSKMSPAGEDFFFTVPKENLASEIEKYARSFDAEEHAKMWIDNPGHGQPDEETLIQDAKDIDNELWNLYKAVDDYFYEKDHKKEVDTNSANEKTLNGGKGSGNFGHSGRPGEVGGSAPSGYGGAKQERRLKKTVSREDVKKSVEEARSKYYLGKSRYEKVDKDGKLVMHEPLNDKDYKQALEDYASKVKELRDLDSKSDDMRVKQGLAKIARIEDKIGKTALVTTDDISGAEGYISSFIDKDGKEYWYERHTEEVRDYGSDHKEYVAPAVEKARKDGNWDSYEITGSQIKKKLKDYGINTEGLSVSKSRGGYSDAWHISGSGIKTDLPSVEKIVKEKLEHIDRDERTYEILAGGNTYVFVRDEDRNSYKINPQNYITLKNKIEELEKALNGGAGSGNFGHAGRPGERGGSAPTSTASQGRGALRKGIADRVRETGGFTVNTQAEFYDIGKTKGYSVGGQGTEKSISKEDWQDVDKRNKAITDFVAENAKVFYADPDHACLGGWEDNGKIYLDVSRVYKNKKQAVRAAMKTDQDAIFDFKTGDSPRMEDLIKQYKLEDEAKQYKGIRAKERGEQ